MPKRRVLLAGVLLSLGVLLWPGCTPMSNRLYVERHPEYRGINRVAIFLERWPIYRQLKRGGEMHEDFIDQNTPFLNAWERARRLPPRAVDVLDVDDRLMGELLLEAFRRKGYQPFIARLPSPGVETPATLMARYLVLDPGVDAFLFCFYSPTLYFASAEKVPSGRGWRSYTIKEIVRRLNPGGEGVIWAGPHARNAPPDSITHAFVYLSMSLFRARDNRLLWAVAGSQVRGRMRVLVWGCPPEPTQENYWADVTVIRRLMINNLRCRLRYLIPDSF
ncbi:MAG: hypothetical protein JRI59_03810 [Deltaproteobacteria bacterium]|nr:hypothetical protein [Deltaproteobacteria bacterium]